MEKEDIKTPYEKAPNTETNQCFCGCGCILLMKEDSKDGLKIQVLSLYFPLSYHLKFRLCLKTDTLSAAPEKI